MKQYPEPVQEENPIPWIPEGAWIPEVGDRVRVRLNGECQRAPQKNSPDAMTGLRGHNLVSNGCIGTIVARSLALVPDLVAQGHSYAVELEDVIFEGQQYRGDWFAAIELEKVE